MKLRAVVLSCVLLLGVSIGSPTSAVADPDAVAAAKANLERIHAEASAIDEQITVAAVAADEASAKLVEINADLTTKQASVSAMSDDIGAIAMQQFQSGGLDLPAQLFSSDSDSAFLSGVSALQNEADRSTADLQELQVQQAELAALQEQAAQLEAAAAANVKAKQDLAANYEAKEAEAKAVYDRLDAEEKERLAELQRQQEAAADAAAANEAAAQAQTEAAQGANGTTGDSPSASATPDADIAEPAAQSAGSSRGQRAVNAALSKVGARYVWGSVGPRVFDCSGLTMWAYSQAGVSLPHSSRGQMSSGRSVSRSQLQPGDLVFYYHPVSHVGIYIGNGKIVDASNPRTGVRVTGLNSMPFSGARRIA